MAGRCEFNRSILRKRLAGRGKTNRSVCEKRMTGRLEKKTKEFPEKRMAGRCINN